MQRGLKRMYIRERAGSLMDPDTYVFGKCCVYKGSNTAHRCEIEEIDNDGFVSVLLVDIGRLKYVYGPNTIYQPTVLARMMPALVVECRLYGVSVRDMGNARMLFQNLRSETVTAIVLEYKLEPNFYVVRLIDRDGRDVRELIEENIRRAGEVSHAVGPANPDPEPDHPPSDVDLDAEREE